MPYNELLFQANYRFIFQNSDNYAHWVGLINTFQTNVWIFSFLFCAIVCITIWFVANRTNNELHSYMSLKNICFIIVGILINSIPKSVPKTLRIRWIFVLWCFFCLHWIAAYTSSLISMITKPLYAGNVCNSEDICTFESFKSREHFTDTH